MMADYIHARLQRTPPLHYRSFTLQMQWRRNEYDDLVSGKNRSGTLPIFHFPLARG
jgi:hypothetical protein